MRIRHILIIILPILLLLSLPVIGGFYTKYVFKHYLQMLQTSSTNLQFTLLDYHQGALTSHATVEMSYHDAGQLPTPGLQPKIILHTKIHHGPIVFDRSEKHWTLAAAFADAKVDYPLELQYFLSESTRKQPMVQAHALFRFNGEIKQNLLFSPVELNNTVLQGTSIKWDGLSSQYVIRMHKNRHMEIDSTATIGSFKMSASTPVAMAFDSKPISLKSTGATNSDALWTGTASLVSPFVYYMNAKNQATTIEGLNLNLAAHIDENSLYNLTFALALNKFDMPWNSIARLAPITANYAIKNMRTENITALQALMNNHSEPKTNDTLMRNVATIFNPELQFTTDGELRSSLGDLQWKGEANQFIQTQMLPYFDWDGKLRIVVAETLAIEIAKLYLAGQPPKTMPAAVKTENMDVTPPAKLSMFQEKVAVMLKQGKMTLPLAMELMSLQQRNLTREQFVRALQPLHLPPAVFQELQTAYVYGNGQPQVAATAPVEPVVETPEAYINQLVQQGYLLRDKSGNLEAQIVHEKGMTRINAVAI